jgi:hypothetical protein
MVATSMIYWACRTAEVLRRTSFAFLDGAAGFASLALAPAEDHALTTRFYKRERPAHEGFFGWEQPWLERDLPAPPATILMVAVVRPGLLQLVARQTMYCP